MIQYPISFHARSESASGIGQIWQIESQNLKIDCAVPVEFEGPGGAFSPEDLFAQALTNCFVATFKVYAEKSNLGFGQIIATSELIVDLAENKKPVMKKCFLNVKILNCENAERVKFIAKKAFEAGFILNSVKTEVVLDLEVT
jgi:organic hydroperoxide reductase OsmC/OhrA